MNLSVLPVDPGLFGAFLGVMAVMAATPGPANLFAVATGVEKGPGPALIGVAGMNAATLAWFAAAALGLGALVAAFPALFRLVAVGGALYVGWLGVKAIRGALSDPRQDEAAGQPAPRSVRRLGFGARGPFFDGFAVQIANPKAVLFFTAVLPPFIDMARPLAPQLALFAVAVIGLDALSMSAYGLSGAALTRRMARPGFRRGFGLFVGGLLLLAASLILVRL